MKKGFFQIKNLSDQDVSSFEEILHDFLNHTRKKLGYDKPFKVFFVSDPENSLNPLGKTAHYDPSTYTITVYVDGRHPKDIMRSVSHETVHHAQNCRGDLKPGTVAGEDYAQQDEHLREMEREAYEKGNMIFRDYTDGLKTNKKKLTIYLEAIKKGITPMISTQQTIKNIIHEVISEMQAPKGGGEAPEVGELHEVTTATPEWVGQLLDMEAENEGAEAGTVEITPEVEEEYQKYNNALEHALEKLVGPEMMYKMLDDEAAYLVMMTLRGEGVGIWDGSWEHYEKEGVDLEDLDKKLKQYLNHYVDDTGGGVFNDALRNAVDEAGDPQESQPTMQESGAACGAEAPSTPEKYLSLGGNTKMYESDGQFETFEDEEGDLIHILPITFSGNIDKDIEMLLSNPEIESFLYSDMASSDGITDENRKTVYWGADVQDYLETTDLPQVAEKKEAAYGRDAAYNRKESDKTMNEEQHVDPVAWAKENNLPWERGDSPRSIIINVESAAADQLSLPADVDWQVEQDHSGNYIIYTTQPEESYHGGGSPEPSGLNESRRERMHNQRYGLLMERMLGIVNLQPVGSNWLFEEDEEEEDEELETIAYDEDEQFLSAEEAEKEKEKIEDSGNIPKSEIGKAPKRPKDLKG